jgi:hypothetical protein
MKKDNQTTLTKLLPWIIGLFFSFSLCVTMFNVVQETRFPANGDSVMTYYAHSLGWDKYSQLRQEWKSRFFSMYLSGQLFKPTQEGSQPRISATKKFRAKYFRAIGWWFAGWLFLINLIYLACDKKKALLFMLFTFVTIVSANTIDQQGHRPWDMPILFFCTLSVFLALKNKEHFLLLILPLAMGFKETAIVFSLLLLANKKHSVKKNLAILAGTVLVCFLVKGLLDTYTANEAIIMTMTTADSNVNSFQRLALNFTVLFTPFLFQLITLNAGTALLFACTPFNRQNAALKLIMVILSVSLFLWGMINELRIWYELLPVSLAGIYLWDNPQVKEEIGL